jgi:hypothetical protein
MACTHTARLGASASDTWDRARNPACGTKPVRPYKVRSSVELHELTEVNLSSEMRVYCISVVAQSIACELEDSFGSSTQITHQFPSAASISLADVMGDNQFALAVECQPRPDTTPFFRATKPQMFVVCAYEAVQLICLYQVRAKSAKFGV